MNRFHKIWALYFSFLPFILDLIFLRATLLYESFCHGVCVYVCVCMSVKILGDIARRRATSYGAGRLVLIGIGKCRTYHIARAYLTFVVLVFIKPGFFSAHLWQVTTVWVLLVLPKFFLKFKIQCVTNFWLFWHRPYLTRSLVVS